MQGSKNASLYDCSEMKALISSVSVVKSIYDAFNEPPRGKTNIVVSEQVRHKPSCTNTEKSKTLEISDLSRRGIVLSE